MLFFVFMAPTLTVVLKSWAIDQASPLTHAEPSSLPHNINM